MRIVSSPQARAAVVRERLATPSGVRKDALARLIGPAKSQPAETPYSADDLEEITGRFAAVVAEAIRESQHDGDREEHKRKEPSRPPIARKIDHWGKVAAATIGALAGLAAAVASAAHALGWF